MADLQSGGGQVADQLGDPLRVGRRSRSSIHCFLKARRRDQLHRPRNLADVLDRLAAFIECSCVGHDSSISSFRVRHYDARSDCYATASSSFAT